MNLLERVDLLERLMRYQQLTTLVLFAAALVFAVSTLLLWRASRQATNASLRNLRWFEGQVACIYRAIHEHGRAARPLGRDVEVDAASLRAALTIHQNELTRERKLERGEESE